MPDAGAAAGATGAMPGAGAMPATGQPQAGAQPATGAAPGQPATGQPATGDGEQQPNTTDSDGLTEAGRKAIAAERDAAAAAKAALKEAQAELKAIKDKDLPEAERQAKRLTEAETENAQLKQQLQEERTRGAVLSAAARLGYADPADAFRLIDPASIELDGDNRPKNVDGLLTKMLEDKPYLKAAAARVAAGGSADGGNAGGAPSGANDMNSQIRRMAGRGS